jgi:6,7-dimethyl-8-ribityllumazine synthase
MSKILIAYTSWYKEYIDKMIEESSDILMKSNFSIHLSNAPGAIELAALAKNKILKDKYIGVLFLGIVIRGETSHYELVTNETFRSIGNLAMDFNEISFINNVICVENKVQLEERIGKNTQNNSKALVNLINEKSS